MIRSAWFEETPQGWEVTRIQHHFGVVLGKMLNGQKNSDPAAREAPYLAAGSIQPERLVTENCKSMAFSSTELDYYSLRKGDVVVVEGGAGYGRSHLLREPLLGWGFQNHVARLRASGDIYPAYLLYCLKACLRSGYIEANNRTATMPSLSREVLGSIQIPKPPIQNQIAIADFLDHETAQIDTLIARQELLINFLEERRGAVVDAVVWSGLIPASMAPTGIDTAPAAPAHWARIRNKELFVEREGLSIEGLEELLTVSHLSGITPRSEKTVTMFEAETLEGYRIVRAGDLVINTMWAWMGALGVSIWDGIVSPAYGVYRARSDVALVPRYFDYLYRSRPYVVEMTRHSRGIWSSRLRLYPDVFLRLPIVLPPVEEQNGMVSYLDDQTAKIDTLIAKADELIALSKERRAALITAAVTGQIDLGKSA